MKNIYYKNPYLKKFYIVEVFYIISMFISIFTVVYFDFSKNSIIVLPVFFIFICGIIVLRKIEFKYRTYEKENKRDISNVEYIKLKRELKLKRILNNKTNNIFNYLKNVLYLYKRKKK